MAAGVTRKTVSELDRDWQVIKTGTRLQPVFSGRPELTVHPRGRVGAVASTGRDERGRVVRVAVDGRPDPALYRYVERFGFSASGGPFFGDSPRSVAFHGTKRDVRPDVLWVSGKAYETARFETVLVGNGSSFLYRTREERNRAKIGSGMDGAVPSSPTSTAPR